MVARALIDGDVVAYRAAAGATQVIQWEAEVASVAVYPDRAADVAVRTVREWASLANVGEPIVCLSSPHNFRKVLLPTYKAGRKPKPEAYPAAVAALRAAYDTREVAGLEADDLLGILLTTPKYAGSVVLTIDKDLRTVPGLHLNPDKETFPGLVSEGKANLMWLMQSLHGDSTDNYSGVPGIGPKKAAKILAGLDCTDPLIGWGRVVGTYRAHGLTDADAITTTRVARILRRADYDKSSKEVLLWHPRTPPRLPLARFSSASTLTPPT